MLNETLQRVRAAVEDQVFAQFFFLGRNVRIRRDVSGIHDGHIQTGLHAVIQHDRVQSGAGLRCKAKGEIAYAQRSHHAREILFDQSNPFDGFNCGFGELLVTSGERESQCIIDEIFRLESVIIDCDVVDAFGDLEFFITRLGHAILVDGEHDHSRVMSLCQCKYLICFFAARFKMS